MGVRPLMRPDPFYGFLMGFNPCKPTSTGYLQICSKDPTLQPKIYPNYLDTDYDKKIGHFRRYNKNDFKNLLRICKIKYFDLRYFDFIGFCLIYLSNHLVKNNLNNFSLKIKLWNFLIPISRILDFFLMKYFFGKSLLVKIKKI